MAIPGRYGYVLVVSLAAAFCLLTPVASAAAQPRERATGDHVTGWFGAPVKYVNAAGYYVPGKYHSVTDVKGSWIVPKISSSCSPSHTGSQMETIIGIDGIKTSYYLDVGTVSGCVSYGAFYAVYPSYPTVLSMKIHPGDYISAELKYSGSKFTISLKDLNTSGIFSKAVAGSSAPRVTADWAVVLLSSTYIQLAPFGTVKFGQDYTGVTPTNTATVSGSTHSIGKFPGHIRFWMYDSTGTIIRAEALALSSNGLSFSVVWKHY